MKLTSGINNFLSQVRAGTKGVVFLFDDDCYAIKNQFGGSNEFIRFIEKESETVVVTYESDEYIISEYQKINKDIKLVQVKEANEMAYDNFVISAKSKNKEAALKFINFIHQPEIYKKCLEEYPCVCLNKETIKLMDKKWLANPAANVDQAIIEKAHVTGDVGNAASYYDDVFAAMKN